LAAIGLLAILAAVFSNVDSIISKVNRWRNPDPPRIAPFPKGVGSLPIPGREHSSSEVVVEAVYAPLGEPNLYNRHYDVYLYNPAREVLFTALKYSSHTAIPHGDAIDSGPILPNVVYNIEYRFGYDGVVPLSPPYRVGKGARGAIRFYFHPSKEIDGLPHWFTFDLVDASTRTLRIVDNDDSYSWRMPRN